VALPDAPRLLPHSEDPQDDLRGRLLTYLGLAIKHKYLVAVVGRHRFGRRRHRHDAHAENLQRFDNDQDRPRRAASGSRGRRVSPTSPSTIPRSSTKPNTN